MAEGGAAAGTLQIERLFPLAIGRALLPPDPLDTAVQLQVSDGLRGEAASNPDPGCAWTGDLNGVWQLQRDPRFAALIASLLTHSWTYLE
ncbi:MAG: hypothetical protein ACK5GZ_06415, partial [Cyanobium sp.]